MAAHEIHAHHPTTARDSSQSEWSSILELIPPAFGLIAPRSIARQGLDLISNAVNTRRFSSVLTDAQIDLRAAGVPIIVTENRAAPPISSHSNLTRPQRRWLGQLGLELYFAQLFRRESAVLDLRPSRLGVNSSRDAVWCPRPVYVQWDRQFLHALRDVYAGFFLGESERFRAGVSHLGLGSSCTPILRRICARRSEGSPLCGLPKTHRFTAISLRLGSTSRRCTSCSSRSTSGSTSAPPSCEPIATAER